MALNRNQIIQTVRPRHGGKG